MKILNLPAYCYPEEVASSHLGTAGLEKMYKEEGIYTEKYAPTPSRGINAATRKKYKKIKYEVLNDGMVTVYRFPMFKEGRRFIFRMFRYVLVNIIQYFKGIKAKDVDLIMGSSTPPTQSAMLGLVKKKLSRKYRHTVPYIFNLQDIFPDSLVTAGITHKGSFLWKIGRKIENFGYSQADKIIVISQDFKDNIMEKGVPEDKIVIIPNRPDVESVEPVERKDNVLFGRYHLDPNKFYVCYSGNVGYSQNIELLGDTAEKVAEKTDDIMFVIIGEGAAKDDLIKMVENRGLKNMKVLPFQPYEEIAHVFSLGDAGMIISKPGIGRSSVPSKTMNIMAAERPIIASFDKDSDLADLIENEKCGIVADAGKLDELVNAVMTLYSDKEKCLSMGKNGRAYVLDPKNDQFTSSYVNLIKSVVSNAQNN